MTFMVINFLKISLSFTILFLVITFLLKPYQLMGLTDYGYWLSAYYNFINFNTFNTSLNYGHSFFSSPLLLILFPFAYIKNTILFIYILNYFTYLSWFSISYYLLFRDFDIKKTIFYFILFFSSITILFNYNLNYNGWESVYISVPFLTLAYYFLFIKREYKKSLFFYLPLFFLKTQFGFILFFIFIAIYVQEKNVKYLYYALFSLMLFFIYLKLLSFFTLSDISHDIIMQRYGYLLDFSSINNILKIIFNKILIKLSLMIAFFLPFVFLINLKKIKKEDFISFFLILFPTFAYCFLSTQTAMSYWTHEHYVLPVLPLVFIMILKYNNFNKITIFAYFITNIMLLLLILWFKQPWQYKYYQDETQLLNKIVPILDLVQSDNILTEDRTGIYFANYKVNYIDYISDKNRVAKYVIFNMRYSYLAQNIQLTKKSEEASSYKYIENYAEALKKYGVIYLNYPFVVFQKDIKSSLFLSSDILDEWDSYTIEGNKW